MAKYLLLFLILAVFFLFYPFRDLYVREDVFSTKYTLVKKGFWTRNACVDAAKAQAAEDFRCSKRTMMGAMLSTSARYTSSGHELDAID